MGLPALYKISGIAIKSSVPFAQLPPATESECVCAFQVLPPQGSRPFSTRWFRHFLLQDGEIWLSVGRYGADYLLRFPDLADFLVSADGKEIRCYPASGTPLETIRHLFLDQVMPFVVNLKGMQGLHASSVSINAGAVAFAAVTGGGKSTLAASFSREGCSLLTDDCLAVMERGGEIFAIPSYPGVRLWPKAMAALFGSTPFTRTVAHYTMKQRLGIDSGLISFCSNPLPLKRIYLLALPQAFEAATAIHIEPLPRREALVELIKRSYLLDTTDQQALVRQFDCFERLVKTVPVRRLTIPRDLDLLTSARKVILDDLQD